ncbi:MAG: aminotransferase class I/II-fold pyridoxal phosphate-dependent enzyme [Proteobacteria bacterium]|nr:aminotransferase class I/II-fold pyridoxal phosphate-dependent enzyme [Pseudomonadota bacterium]
MIEKWSDFGTSIFSLMTAAANRSGAINLAQGFPNFDGPQIIKDAAIRAINGSWNQYAPSIGLEELRQLIQKRYQITGNLHFDHNKEITVFSGATEALFCTFLALFKEHDEIITFSPYFDCYPAGAYAARAKLIDVPLDPKTWTFSESILVSKINPQTKAILVNTPHNPTGRVFDRSEMEMIAKIAQKYDLLVITDEVYEELIYDGLDFVRMATLPGMKDRTITISSTAKTFSLTGWKIGYICAPVRFTNEIRAVHQFTVFCSSTPLQAGICEALKMGTEYYETFRHEYTQRRDLLHNSLTDLGFKIKKSEGTYFLVADYSHVSDLPDLEFALWLTETWKVAVIPTSVFYNDQIAAQKNLKQVRFAFCKDFKTLEAGIENLRKLCTHAK